MDIFILFDRVEIQDVGKLSTLPPISFSIPTNQNSVLQKFVLHLFIVRLI